MSPHYYDPFGLKSAFWHVQHNLIALHYAVQGYQLLNCDDHASFLRRHGKDPAQYRPDICHQALLAILDSPLAKAGHLKARKFESESMLMPTTRIRDNICSHTQGCEVLSVMLSIPRLQSYLESPGYIEHCQNQRTFLCRPCTFTLPRMFS